MRVQNIKTRTQNLCSSKSCPGAGDIVPTNLFMVEEEEGILVENNIPSIDPANVAPNKEGEANNMSINRLVKSAFTQRAAQDLKKERKKSLL
jgi:hypothetical protein